MTSLNLQSKDVEWVVNSEGELGVKIGQQFFFLYKGHSLQYRKAEHDDGSPMMWRPVEKREFGESCRSTTSPLPKRFDHDGNEWFLLPKRVPEENPQPAEGTFAPLTP